MKDELDDQLTAMLRHHIDNHEEAFPGADALDAKSNAAVDSASLPSAGSVSVTIGEPENLTRVPRERGPDAHEMASGPDTFATPVSRPGSIPAQMGQAITGAAKPKSTPAVNLAAPMGAHDEELAGLQRDAKATRSMSRLGQAVTDFTERPTNLLDYAQRLGGGGVSAAPKSKMWQENAAEGDRAIADLGQRREADAAMTKSKTMGEMAADDNDPNGQTAQTYRSVLVKFAPDLSEQLKGASPKQMRAIAPWLEKFATENNDLIQASAKAEADAKAKAATDAEKLRLEAKGDERYAQGQKNADRNHEDSLGMQRAILGDNRKRREEDKDLKATDKLDDDTAALAKASGSDAAMGRKALDVLDASIAANKGDVPGVGTIKSKLPDFMLSDAGNKVRQEALDALAIMLSVRSGATVSPEELARNKGIYGINGNQQQFEEGVARIRRDFDAALAAKQAGFGPDVKKKFVEQGGTLAIPLGKTVKMRFPNGGVDEVPAAEVEEAKAAGGVPL